MSFPIITFITDFGLKDNYVAAMKGTILSTVKQQVQFIDVSHLVNPQDVMEAAFILKNSYHYFPPETIHVIVVDPHVGTERYPVAMRFQDQYFIGPDNGIFSLLLEDQSPDALIVLNKPSFWRVLEPSATFHGRDIFAPVAAHLANGVALHELGSQLESLRPMYWANPVADAQGIQGWVVHIDHYGNAITNIPRTLFESVFIGQPFKCYVGSSVIQTLSYTYADADAGMPLMLFGSNDYLEIAIREGNAAMMLSMDKGQKIHIVFQSTH